MQNLRSLFAMVLLVVLVQPAHAAEEAKAASTGPQARLPRESVDQFFGSFTTQVGIEVPPFYGIEPSIGLAYDSSAGNGWLGVGWNLGGFPTIERTGPRRGVPKYTAADVFSLDGQELVRCAPGAASPSCQTGGTHATKIESYNRITYDQTADRWSIWDKSGTKRTFAPVHNVSDGARWYAWIYGLTRVEDPYGHVVDYQWGVNRFGAAWAYPSSVSYHGGKYRVTLHWEARPDKIQKANGLGIATVHGRIKTIEVTTQDRRVRAYKLGYTNTGGSTLSKLATVTTFGTDVVPDATGTITGGTSLPPTTFTYGTGAAGWTSNAALGAALPADAIALEAVGRTGWAKTTEARSCNEMVSGSVVTWNWTESTCNQEWVEAFSKSTDLGVALVDVNGDGRTDVLKSVGATRAVWLNTGTGWAHSASWSQVVPAPLADDGEDVGTRLDDVDGDGRIDFIVSGTTRAVYLNTGTGWTSAPSWAQSIPAAFIAYGDTWKQDCSRAATTVCQPKLTWTSSNVPFRCQVCDPDGGTRQACERRQQECTSREQFCDSFSTGWQTCERSECMLGGQCPGTEPGNNARCSCNEDMDQCEHDLADCEFQLRDCNPGGHATTSSPATRIKSRAPAPAFPSTRMPRCRIGRWCSTPACASSTSMATAASTSRAARRSG